MLNRRTLITGLISLVAAPAIVRAGSLMPVKQMLPIFTLDEVAFTTLDFPKMNGSFWIKGASKYMQGDLFTLFGHEMVVTNCHETDGWQFVIGACRVQD